MDGSSSPGIIYESGDNTMICSDEPCEVPGEDITGIYCVTEGTCPENLYRYKNVCVKECPDGTENNGYHLCEEPRDPVCAYMFKGLYWFPWD